MKKILLALMMMVSVSFASHTIPTYITYTDGRIFKLDSSTFNPVRSGSNKTTEKDYYSYSAENNIPFLNYVYIDYTGGYYSASFPHEIMVDFSVRYYVSTDCVSPSTVVNGECVKAVDTNNPDCDPVASQFTNSTTGKCEDCMPFTNYSSRASCACSALGSTYTPITKNVSYWYVTGVYSYKKQVATCDDGTKVAIYYDPVNTTPTDSNTTTPTDTNGTNTDTNTTVNTPDVNGSVVVTPTTTDVVNALKSIQSGQKDSNTALKELGIDLKTVNTKLSEQGYTFNSILDKIVAGNEKADARYALMDAEFKGQTTYRNMMGKWVDLDLKNATAQLGATVDVKNAVNGTTGAVNTQGDKITGKLDDILNAIKDGNGSTDMQPTNDLLEKIKGDTNATAKGVDKLHDDLNSTNDILGKIKGMFDNNDSYKTPDVNQSSFSLSDLLPDEGWFETNKLTLNFNNYGGDCYCQTAEFTVAGKTFIFPPQEALDVIPFTYVSNIFMAFIFVLGAKDFLRD